MRKSEILFPETVFYVYTPQWRETAAGVRVLHYLCDYINSIGAQAWVVIQNPYNDKAKVNTNLKTPILTKKIEKEHQLKNLKQIVFYSETVPGNPIKATNIVRYLLNFPGALGGPTTFDENELLLSYSKSISKSLNCDRVLFIPAVKLEELPLPAEDKSDLNLVYAGKYRAFIGRPELPRNISYTEIFREGPNKQSRKEVLNLLAKAKVLYAFENTTLATEAMLLGTPCIFVPNAFLGKIIAEEELGSYGYAIGITEKNLKKAQDSIELGRQRYLQVLNMTENNLAAELNYINGYFNQIQKKSIFVPTSGLALVIHRWRQFHLVRKNLGARTAIQITFNHLKANCAVKFRRLV